MFLNHFLMILEKTADFYKLERLDPGYQVFLEKTKVYTGDSLKKFMMFLRKKAVKSLENLSKLQMKTMI